MARESKASKLESTEKEVMDCGGPECYGPEPVPWLSWKHCFKIYEFRTITIPLGDKAATVARNERVTIRVRYEHAMCLLGRKQGPIVHSLTLLPQEQVRIYEFDRYRQSTSVQARFSQRTSFYNFSQKVASEFNSVKADVGGSVSSNTTTSAGGGGGIDLGIISFGAEAAVSNSFQANSHFDLASVSENFSQVTEVSSQAVETERSIVVSTFEESESGQSTSRTLRNDNDCRSVTYFIRRVFEVYSITTRIVGIEVGIGGQWVSIDQLPDDIRKEILKFVEKVKLGQELKSRIEIQLPTDGLLFETELAHCCSCEPEREERINLTNDRLRIRNQLLQLEASRRQALITAGTLDPFKPCCPDTIIAP